MRDFKTYTILSAKAATGVGRSINVKDFRHCVLSFDTADSGSGTTKIQGSILEAAPDFTAAQTAANQWDYVQIKDLEDGSSVDGDTGVVVAGTDDHRQFEVNINGLTWLTANVTAYAAGSITVKVTLFND